VLNQVPFDGTQYIYGNIKIILPNEKPWIWKYPDTFDTFFLANRKGWLSQQACFIHRSLFAGQKYNTDYKIISDWIHAVRSIIFNKCSYRHIPVTIAEYDGSGTSSNHEKTWAERNKWIEQNINDVVFKSLVELESHRELGLGSIVPMINKTHKFKKRIGKLIVLLYHVNSFFSLHKPKQ